MDIVKNNLHIDKKSWQEIQKQNICNIDDLCQFLNIDNELKSKIDNPKNFIINIPIRLANKIEKSKIDDPIFLQFIPLKKEINKENFLTDPLNEKYFRKTNTLIHKYNGRVLILMSGACAMHCRYCFRSHFEYKVRGSLEKEIDYIASDKTISEVILSGGDPLSVENNILMDLCMKLSSIENVKRIRFHTRFPIGIPERIDDGFIMILEELMKKLQVWFVIHTNHPIELDEDVLFAIKKIQMMGIPVLSHSVFLKGVNDSSDVLYRLFEKMINNGIIPYYMNKLDKVKGSEYFELPIEKQLSIFHSLSSILPGYGVPRFVEEVPYKPSKINLGPSMFDFTSFQQDQSQPS